MMHEVKAILRSQKFLSDELIESETEHFFTRLGLNAWFFSAQSASDLCKYIVSLASAKMISKLTGQRLNVQLHDAKSGRATFIVPSEPGSRSSKTRDVERQLESDFLGEGYKGVAQDASKKLPYRLQCYRTHGTVAVDMPVHLRIFIVEEPQYPANCVTDPAFVVRSVDDLRRVTDKNNFASSTNRTRVIISEMLEQAATPGRMGPVIRGFHYADTKEFRLLVCFRHGTTHSVLSGLADMYHSYNLSASRKYVEQFSHGYTIHSLYLQIDHLQPEALLPLFEKIKDDASFMYCLPRSSLSVLVTDRGFSFQEHAYLYAAWKFAFHFLSRYGNEYAELMRDIERAGGAETAGKVMASLGKLKVKLDKDALQESRLLEFLLEHASLARLLYKDFEAHHKPSVTHAHPERRGDAAYLDAPERKALLQQITRTVTNDLQEAFFRMFLVFNHHVLRTNFYQRDKVAISFRLEPGFLNVNEYALKPYAVVLVVGSEFRGFHVRFHDVARGGVRVIRSRNEVEYQRNLTTTFDEGYGLASTQQRKNKDIPEGGSKGVILLHSDHQSKAESAFQKYVDALLDLLLPSKTVVDYLKKEEILFLGPDEGTADLMNWASAHARSRGAPFWKAFTTGKSPSRGGIPHDTYGMTTRSIHAYVLGSLKKLGLDEAAITKFQTGGPDGDLGSNEILISKDRTIGIVDGGGVLYDPAGLDRAELRRVAEKRQLSRHFDRRKLSPAGWYIDCEHSDLTAQSDASSWPLPADVVAAYTSGVALRNTFHLSPLAKADLFVPCGGRPRAVDLTTVHELLPNNVPRFKVIIEGANLFMTQEARLRLEKAGCVLYKDASANKGGVTSSSLEVLAALALSDDEFSTHMCVADGAPAPPFYSNYVTDVQNTIQINAELEFEAIWREHELRGEPRSVLSDTLSEKINSLTDSVSESTLYDQSNIKFNVLLAAMPPTLLKLLGLNKILERVPPAYAKAIFCSFLASRFVYTYGLAPSEFRFFEFIQAYASTPVDALKLLPH
jgi:glutamate dehydrogenase